ncbi:Maf1-domain-containing protein [Heliocybe sulcata]|uniref:Repressor of RNA polymerase III transcription MAF1 n=1 Tax=Heliocybe sulcata TaxID=5364 RepID=A0A5C3MZF1_9AGAM|nr:Maf1-domain-containing protein [Heliocybe sulcata]
MKYIEYPELQRLAQALTHEGPECSVHTRIEAYSCKNIKRDKKLFRSLESAYENEVSSSPPLPSWMAIDREAETTPFGPFDKHSSRKTLYLLIATLNVAFPDHEFSDVRPAHFNKEESGASVLNSLSTTLISPQRGGMPAPRTYSSYPPTSPDLFPSSTPTSSSPINHVLLRHAPPQVVTGTHPTLYRVLDDVIGLADCEVFSFVPDMESDPHANDFSDDGEDFASIGDEEGSSSEEETTFQFDPYDVDEHKPRSDLSKRTWSDESDDSWTSKRPSFRMRRRGTLLWSSHWFFLNRKLKRILFISVWSRTKGRDWLDSEGREGRFTLSSSERFLGWEGSVGAGARAMGLRA